MRKEFVGDQHDNTHSNAGIGQIKRGPVPVFVVNINKIDNIAQSSAIDQVTNSAADQECQRQAERPFGFCSSPQPFDQHQSHATGHAQKEPTLPASMIAQEAKRPAMIVHQGPIQSLKDRLRDLKIQGIHSDHLGPLVQNDQHDR